ncbi:protein GVQW3-like [Drosophila elegans]|uniref:protein GVQW3-like n=1 Tax=Drosophila elegans TaxID=30023 RepID=UPI001BC84E78|nr:protein GVQW3-like [Drosophila elegans]XP_041565914.1 protein GVQW3-like [Drosophila elegans]XP_041565964.1 protein GVQW3-like [Drosophila elegans]XP_041565965.1 protein GVQW3-like [Drosophila elegans]
MEQRAGIKFCFKLGKTFTETHKLMKQVYGDDCLSRTSTYEWFNRFKNGRESLEDDERSGRPKSAVIDENIQIVRDFVKKEPKSSLRYMEMELEISYKSIHRILIEHLGMRKLRVTFSYSEN